MLTLYNEPMEDQLFVPVPNRCPACSGELAITRLRCQTCGTEVTGSFSMGRLANLREPHATVIELFLRARGNLKDLERELGLSYPTVRARLEEALAAAGLERPASPPMSESERRAQRTVILEALESGEIGAADAVARLRTLQKGRNL